MAYFRPALDGDAELLAPTVRERDIKEMWHSHGIEPLEGLSASFKNSAECYSIIHNEKVIGMFGYSIVGGSAAPWLIGSDELPSIAREFLKGSKKWIQDVLTKEQVLFNYVHTENKESIRWLKWLGFSFVRKLEYGVHPAPFYEFVKIRED